MPRQLPIYMPIGACGTIRQAQVNMGNKQFLPLRVSAFVLACSYTVYILFEQWKSGNARRVLKTAVSKKEDEEVL